MEAENARLRETRLREQSEASQKFSAVEVLYLRDDTKGAEAKFYTLPTESVIPNADRAVRMLTFFAEYHVRRQQWQLAITNLTVALDLNPAEHRTYHGLAPLLARVRDVQSWRRVCRQALVQFKGTTDAFIADRMAKDALILADTNADLNAIAEWANTSITLGSTNPAMKNYLPAFQCTKGFSEYRQGHYRSALDWDQESLSRSRNDWIGMEAHLISAMANFRLMAPEAAHSELAAAVSFAAEHAPALPRDVLFVDRGVGWADWITAPILMDEAKALIEDQSATPEE